MEPADEQLVPTGFEPNEPDPKGEAEDSEAVDEARELINKLNEYGWAFDRLCQERHDEGQEEYGKLTFLGNDVVRMMMEELADTANYCRYQFIKLMVLQEQLQEKLVEEGFVTDDGETGDQNIQMGWKAFKGTKDTGWGN